MQRKFRIRFAFSCSDNRKSKPCTELSRSIQNRNLVGLLAIVITFAMCEVVAQAQQPANVPRIGLVAGGRGFGSAGDAFRQSLRQLGWIAGRNIAIESRLAEASLDKLPQLASELVQLKVSVIVADSDPAARAAKQATRVIPIVVVAVGDPVREGLVSSLARPGGNITGLTSISEELSGKRLELLKEAFPKVSRVAVFWNPANASNLLEFREMEVTARTLGLKLQSLEVRGLGDFQAAFARAAKDRASALILVRDPLIDSEHFRILDFAVDKRVPSMHGEEQFVEAGGLMSYGPSRVDLFRRAAVYVDKILKGAKPADLPVEQPTKFELVINLKTAKQIGLTIPQSVLFRADKVIK
jgi:putative ABC transport system substrate-binding protein